MSDEVIYIITMHRFGSDEAHNYIKDVVVCKYKMDMLQNILNECHKTGKDERQYRSNKYEYKISMINEENKIKVIYNSADCNYKTKTIDIVNNITFESVIKEKIEYLEIELQYVFDEDEKNIYKAKIKELKQHLK